MPRRRRAAPLLFADGSIRVLLDTIRPDVLLKLATRSTGEIIVPEAVPALVIPRQAAVSDQKLLKIELSPGPPAWIE